MTQNQIIPLSMVLLVLPGAIMQSIHTEKMPLTDARGFYKIQHTSDPGSSVTCVLTLTYASSGGSYAIVEGVKEPDEGQCPGSRITAGAEDLCVVPGAYWAQRADSERSTLVVTTRTSESNFTINVYLSVDTCGVASRSDSSWSGVASSPFGGAQIPQTDCHSTLSGLPADAKLKVTALSPLGINAATLSIAGKNRVNVAAVSDAVYVEIRGSGTVIVRRALDDPDSTGTVGAFALVYTVVRCGDIPKIENTNNHTRPQAPYLPGSIVQYSCRDKYQFKNKSNIRCEENIGDAAWTDDVMCIPVPWCLDPLPKISGTKQIVVSGNRTIRYECEEGYESAYEPELIVICSTTDEDRQPWRWNDTDIEEKITCSPVQCKVDEIQYIKNGSLEDNGSTYNYTDTITYHCDKGYTKNTTGQIVCQSDETWSAVPGCVQEPKDQEGLSEDEKLYIIIAVVVVVVVAIVVVVTFCVLRRGRIAERLYSRQGEQQNGGVATSNIDENPYHDLEGPDVVTSHNVINHSEGAYDRVELDVLNVGAVTGSVKVKPAVDKSTKPKSSKKSKKEEKKAGTAPPAGAENLYGEIKKTQPSPKAKKSQKKQEPEPLYAEAPPVPVKQHGEQEVDLVDNDLYDRSQQPSASNQGNVSAKGYTNTAADLVANDLYDSMQ